MTPNEALNLLDSIVSQVSANRQQHQTINEAIQVLSNLINNPSNEK